MTNGGTPGSNGKFYTHSRHGQLITELPSSAELGGGGGGIFSSKPALVAQSSASR